VLKSETKSKMSVKLHSNIVSGATDGLVFARNGPLQQVRTLSAGGNIDKDAEDFAGEDILLRPRQRT
jgi:hypothetical protein